PLRQLSDKALVPNLVVPPTVPAILVPRWRVSLVVPDDAICQIVHTGNVGDVTASAMGRDQSSPTSLYGTFPRIAQADAVSHRRPWGEPEQYASRTASLMRAFRAGARLAK